MKKLLLTSVLLVSLSPLFHSCSKSDSGPATSTSTSSILLQSNWRVTYFNDNGPDNTANYSDFKFTFVTGGSVTAANNLFSIPGTWSTYLDDSQNKLLLNFTNTLAEITALNHDWHIVEKTSVKLRMEDESGGAGGTDYLTLEKN